MKHPHQKTVQTKTAQSTGLKSSLERIAIVLVCASIISAWCSIAWAKPMSVDELKARAYAGQVVSQVDLGLAHLRVQDSIKNRKIGLGWIIVAAGAGNDFAVQLRNKAFSQVQPEIKQDAQRIAFNILRTIEDRQSRESGGARAKAVDIVHLSSIGPVETVQALIKDGADVDVTTKHGVSPLSAAFQSRRYDLAKVLVGAGANAKADGPSGQSLLLEAVKRDDLPAVALLVGHGASVFSPDENGTPIFQSNAASKKVKAFLKIEERKATRKEVREIQARLKAAGYKPGPLDGLIGRKTWAAFDALAKDKGFELEGRNPIAALKAVRDFVPTSEFRSEIAAAVKPKTVAAKPKPSQPKKPQKTNAQIFFEGNMSG